MTAPMRGAGVVPSYEGADRLTVGQATVARELATATNLVTASGSLRLSFFTSRKTEQSGQVRILSGGTAAGATPTLVRLGLYLVDSNGDGTLVASTPNDTALLAGTNAAYTKSWSTPVNVVAGQRYAVGLLVVTGAATPTLVGATVAGGQVAEATMAPRGGGALAGQSDLPSTFTNAGLAATSQRFYAVVLP